MTYPTRRHRLTKPLLGSACGLAVWTTSIDVFAQTPLASAPPEEPIVWPYLAALSLGVVGFAVLAWRRRRAVQLAHASDTVVLIPSLPVESDAALPEQGGSSKMGEYALFALNNMSETSKRRVQPPPTPRSEHQKKECPTCRRQFNATLVLCPFDHTPLVSISRQRRSSGKRTLLARQMCTSCGRRYEAGAKFCLHDGKALVPDSVEDAERAIEFRVCTSCGHHNELEATHCSQCGKDALVTVDPRPNQDARAPAIPVSSCPRCGHVGAPGEAFCPHDGEVLEPMTQLRPDAFPHAGFGTVRKLCTQCGSRFNGESHFCSYDGHKLIDLN